MSPRDKFRANRSLTRGYNDVIFSHQFQTAFDAASMEYDQSLTIAADVTTAAANRWRKEGADAYRRIVENLNNNAAAAQPALAGQLDHKL